MRTVDPLRLLALTYFADPELNQEVLQGKRSSLPLLALPGFSSPVPQPILPQVLEALGPHWDPPYWLPVTPEIPIPVDPTSWVGQPGTKPQEPENDPFYNPPASAYENLQNGEVIAYRPVGLASFWINVAQAWQISYKTETVIGVKQAHVTTVIVPKTNNQRDIVSYQLWEDALNPISAPSYQLIRGVQDPTYDLLLAAGYVVNTPDHEGPDGQFAVTKTEGKSTLDSLRALVSIADKLNISNRQIGLWGYSGGSIASGGAIELQASYAPDLKIVAAAVGGYVTNFTASQNITNGGLFPGFIPAAIIGLARGYNQVDDLNAEIKPEYKWRFNAVGDHSLLWNLINFVGENVFFYLQHGTGYFYTEKVQKIFADSTLGQVAPQFPVMVYQGVQDQLVDVHDVDRVVTNYCQGGTPVDYYRFAATEHILTEVLGTFEPLKFLIKAFDGYVPAPCTSFADATRATVPHLSKDQLYDVVYGNWDKTNIYADLGISPPPAN